MIAAAMTRVDFMRVCSCICSAYAAAVGDETSGNEEEEEGDEDDDQRYGVAMAESGTPTGEAGYQDE